MKNIAGFIVEKRKIVLIVFILLALCCAWLAAKVPVNYKLSEYLPDDSQAKIGSGIMSEEFPAASSLNVMLKGLSDQEKTDIYKKLAQKPHVESVSYETGSEKFNRDVYTMYTLNLDVEDYSPEIRELMSDLAEEYKARDIAISGESAGSVSMGVLPLLFGIALLILLIILFLMCASWAEPFLFVFTIGVAIALNMGTNIILGQVSNITMAIAAVLQLVLSMDYSIMLINRFRQEKQAANNAFDAMKNALRLSFAAISSSAVTTIVGMLALVLMSFTIGRDIGFVLAKGVFFSLLCIFTILPALILAFDSVIDKTAKKSLHFKMDKLGNFSYKARYVISAVFVLLFAGGFLLRNSVKIDYTMEKYNDVGKIFTPDNQIIVIYENKDEGEIAALTEKWIETDGVESVEAYSTTLGQKLTYQELAKAADMDETSAALIYNYYFGQTAGLPEKKIALASLLQFMQSDLAQNERFASLLDASGMARLGERMAAIPPEMMTQEISSKEFAAYTGFDEAISEQLFRYYAVTHGDTPEGEIAIYDFIKFALETVAENKQYEAYIGGGALEKLESAKSEMDSGLGQLVGEKYSRLIINTSFPGEADSTFLFIDGLEKELNGASLGKHYIVGNSVMAYELSGSFPGEMNFIAILTAAAIFLVVLAAFRSFSIPLILVCLIQCAVFITMGAVYLMGNSIYYLPLIIVQCLLMGATIDYGILYCSYYKEARRKLSAKEALVHALNNAIHTIMTSGLILIVVTFALGLMYRDSQQAISEILLTISGGAVCSSVLVVFVLPGIVAALDRFVVKKAKAENSK
ncbi:MAG: MMPL family transporter [Oscillospiraceae bacterium]|jgi:predicted RND superfamily exporter protein|nr:MMPL family transporter [Oscillospiraceae bacterium]